MMLWFIISLLRGMNSPSNTDRRRTIHVALPAPAFFDFQAKRRYVITREEANEYERRMEASRLQAAALEAVAAASQYDPSYNFGYPPGQP